MNLALNTIPNNVKNIHLIAVCGTAMGALAAMLKNVGFHVTGSDAHVYPPMSTFLSDQGIKVLEGFNAQNLSYRPDLVVAGNAVSIGNPEVVAMQEMGLPFCSLPQALNHFFATGKSTLAVVGTHGKTTTSALLAWVLTVAGMDPCFMVGGILKNFGRNYGTGKGPYFVVEGDEYDTAFFDKGPKFLHFRPSHAILTSIEFDHADIYQDLAHVRRAFTSFVTAMQQDSLLIGHKADQIVVETANQGCCRKTFYGEKEGSPWQATGVQFDAPWTRFEVLKNGNRFATFSTRMMGHHNVLNSLAVIALADDIGIPVDNIQKGLETFEGVKRRQEVRGVKREITVLDDFAHHPTAVRETIGAVSQFYRGKRIIAIFEPRTNSSRRKVFQDQYPEAFGFADIVCIPTPPLQEKIPADERFSSEQLVEDLRRRGKSAHFFSDTQAIINYIVKNSIAGDVVLIMSNGGFDNIHERLLDAL